MRPNELRRLLDEILPGEWHQEDDSGLGAFLGMKLVCNEETCIARPVEEPDAALMVAAHNALPALLDLWEAAQKHISDLSDRNEYALDDALKRLEEME